MMSPEVRHMQRWFLVVLMVLLVGCSGAQQVETPPQATVEQVGADAESGAGAQPAAGEADFGAEPERWTNDIHWMRSSAEVKALQLQAYRVATRRVEKAAEGREPGTWAVSASTAARARASATRQGHSSGCTSSVGRSWSSPTDSTRSAT